MKIRLCALGLAAFCLPAGSASLFLYEFTGTPTSDGLFNTVTAQPSFATVSPLTRRGVRFAARENVFSSVDWAQGLNRDENKYLSFTIEVASGYRLTITGLEYSLRRDTTGPHDLQILAYINGLTTGQSIHQRSFIVGAQEVLSGDVKVTFGTPVTGISRVELRIFGYNASHDGGELSIDNLGLSGAIAAVAPTTLGGVTSGNIKAGEYRVTQTLTVPATQTLRIDPGARLRFSRGTGLTVSGTLIAIGSTEQSIQFLSAQSNPAKGDWTGISFIGNDGQSNRIVAVEVAHATTGIAITTSSSTTVRPRLEVVESYIHDNASAGLSAFADMESLYEVNFMRNRIVGNTTGILMESYAESCDGAGNFTEIAGNRISGNKTGIRISSSVSSSLTCFPTTAASFEGNVHGNIVHNNEIGIHATTSRPSSGQPPANRSILSASFYNNLIVSNSANGILIEAFGGEIIPAIINNTIAYNGNAGLSHPAQDPSQFETFQIRNNVIVGNGLGLVAHGLTAFEPLRVVVTANNLFANDTNWVNYAAPHGRLTSKNRNGTPSDTRHNISADPQFAGEGDFHLLSTSSNLNAGDTNNAPTLDFEGQKRLTFPDLGYDETRLQPVLGNIVRNSDGSLQISGALKENAPGRLEASQDLATWHSFRSFNGSQLQLQFDVIPPSGAHSAFRLRVD